MGFIKEDFPINCLVTPSNFSNANLMGIPFGTIGTVVDYETVMDSETEEYFLLINWPVKPVGFGSVVEGWLPSRVIRVDLNCVEESRMPKSLESLFCSCGSKDTVLNEANGEKFVYCRGCHKERR